MSTRNEGAVGDARKRGQEEQAPAATLTEAELKLLCDAFVAIKRAVERILAARLASPSDTEDGDRG